MDYDINGLIRECKTFYNITDFETEILDWTFNSTFPEDLHFNIGHPNGSHKGESLGDKLPYTRLPELIKLKYPNSRVSAPNSFKYIFNNNKYIDDFDWVPARWGSLGTWGTSVQRTANVWGIQSFEFSPIIYHDSIKTPNSILFCVNSKTGGQIQNLNLIEQLVEELKTRFYCVQLASNLDPIIRSSNEIIFNSTDVIKLVSQFETYIGSQNSIYHLSKALNLNIIGILPNNIYPQLVVLPFLTQINHLELEMLTDFERTRSRLWSKKITENYNIHPNESHHIGWLYPDCIHLTERNDGTFRCPTLSINTIQKALNKKIYPFNDDRLWDIKTYSNQWLEA